MTSFTDTVKEKLRKKHDPYAEMDTNELNEIYETVNGEAEKLKDISEYFTDEQTVELASNGVKLTTAKQYKIETKKSPIWNGKITIIFKKWLKTRYPDELEFLRQNDEIHEAIEKVKKKEEKQYITSKDIKRKIKESHKKAETEDLFDDDDEIIEVDEKEAPADDFDIFEKEDTLPIKNPEVEKIETEPSQTQIIIREEPEALPIQQFNQKLYPSEEQIAFLIKRHKFVKTELLDEHDIVNIKKNKYIKKSGWRKFINAFGISIELIEQKVYEQFNDKHAEIRIRAIAPNGQSVEGIGLKSWSELYEKTMHNLIATAWTRAVNRAVSDLVGYGEVSAEELSKTTENESDLF